MYNSYHNNNKTNYGYGAGRPYFCDHDNNAAWEYKLTIGKRKVYQCSRCGTIREEPLNVTLRLPTKKRRRHENKNQK